MGLPWLEFNWAWLHGCGVPVYVLLGPLLRHTDSKHAEHYAEHNLTQSDKAPLLGQALTCQSKGLFAKCLFSINTFKLSVFHTSSACAMAFEASPFQGDQLLKVAFGMPQTGMSCASNVRRATCALTNVATAYPF